MREFLGKERKLQLKEELNDVKKGSFNIYDYILKTKRRTDQERVSCTMSRKDILIYDYVIKTKRILDQLGSFIIFFASFIKKPSISLAWNIVHVSRNIQVYKLLS